MTSSSPVLATVILTGGAGVALNVGAVRVAAACQDLELLGPAHDLEPAREGSPRLATELDLATAVLDALRTRP